MQKSDPELLADWLERRHEPAFHELVGRYAGLVHTTARRTCPDESLAAEVSQLVFISLARKARSLAGCASLGGWLHRTTLWHAANLTRKHRRELRKRELLKTAMETAAHDPSPGEIWQEIQPVLDSALAALSANDREALLLRFYRSLTVPEVAATLGTTTAAAQKRIDRATARLREKLAKRGCPTAGTLAAALATGLAADSSAAVPAVSIMAAKAIAAGSVGGGFLTSLIATATMKSTTVALPLAALVVGGIWLAGQFSSIASLVAGNETLRTRLKTPAIETSVSSVRAAPAVSVMDRKPIDWAEVARQLSGRFAGAGYPSTSLRLRERFRAMTARELSAALDEIAVAKLSESARDDLERILGYELLKRDPETGLTRFFHRYRMEVWSGLLNLALTNWAKQDPDRATAWLARQAAAGAFEGKGLGHYLTTPAKIVTDPVFALLATNPDAAGSILAALPIKLRLRPLASMHLLYLKESEHVAWAEMVRENLSPEDHLKAIAYPTGNWSDGDGAPMTLAETSAYLARIDATEEEVTACVLSVVQDQYSWRSRGAQASLDNDIAALRAWAVNQVPALVEPVIAAGLGAVTRNGENFPEAAKLALRFHASTGNDDLLVPLLECDGAAENKSLARTLASRLADPKMRGEYLRKFK